MAAAAPASAAPAVVVTITAPIDGRKSLDTLIYLSEDYRCDVKSSEDAIRFICRGNHLDLIAQLLLTTELREVWGRRAKVDIVNTDTARLRNHVVGGGMTKKLESQGSPVPKAPSAPKGAPIATPKPALGSGGGVLMVWRRTDRLKPDGKFVYDKVNACTQYSAELCAANKRALSRDIDLGTFFLAKAIINRESVWNPNVRGKSGEIGLMQVKPMTARWLRYQGPDDGLTDPLTNLQFGLKYVDYCLRQANKAKKLSLARHAVVELLLAYYNRGDAVEDGQGQLVTTHGYHKKVPEAAQEFALACGYQDVASACR
jgi:hypothetical protein